MAVLATILPLNIQISKVKADIIVNNGSTHYNDTKNNRSNNNHHYTRNHNSVGICGLWPSSVLQYYSTWRFESLRPSAGGSDPAQDPNLDTNWGCEA